MSSGESTLLAGAGLLILIAGLGLSWSARRRMIGR
jgi:hypothetical protein